MERHLGLMPQVPEQPLFGDGVGEPGEKTRLEPADHARRGVVSSGAEKLGGAAPVPRPRDLRERYFSRAISALWWLRILLRFSGRGLHYNL